VFEGEGYVARGRRGVICEERPFCAHEGALFFEDPLLRVEGPLILSFNRVQNIHSVTGWAGGGQGSAGAGGLPKDCLELALGAVVAVEAVADASSVVAQTTA